MADLTPEELASMLAKLDEVMRQAEELSAQIKARMDEEKRRDRTVTEWSDRRKQSERRTRRRG